MNWKTLFAKPNKEQEEGGRKKKNFKLFYILGVALIVLGLLLFIGIATSKEGEVEIISESSLKEMIEISELSTIEYTYNSTVTVKDKKTEKYHVAYEGTIKAGFDFDKIDVKHKESKRKIVITIPEIKITSVNVNENSLDYIFIKEKYDTEKTFEEAFNACEKDLAKKAKKNETIFKMGRESAIEVISALMKPYEDTLPKDYEIEYK